jgi:hypothetical protein
MNKATQAEVMMRPTGNIPNVVPGSTNAALGLGVAAVTGAVAGEVVALLTLSAKAPLTKWTSSAESIALTSCP